MFVCHLVPLKTGPGLCRSDLPGIVAATRWISVMCTAQCFRLCCTAWPPSVNIKLSRVPPITIFFSILNGWFYFKLGYKSFSHWAAKSEVGPHNGIRRVLAAAVVEWRSPRRTITCGITCIQEENTPSINTIVALLLQLLPTKTFACNLFYIKIYLARAKRPRGRTGSRFEQDSVLVQVSKIDRAVFYFCFGKCFIHN